MSRPAGRPLSVDDLRRIMDGLPLLPMKTDVTAPPVTGVDRIGALPDHMLHHVLSFLPAQAAVQTCMLARRWRHLWRSTTGLHIVGLHHPNPAEDLRVFVDHLLILRERTNLDNVEIRFDRFCYDDEPYLKLWTRYAIMCNVRALTLHVDGPEYLELDHSLVASRHLTTLDLHGVDLVMGFMDFAICPALVYLKMEICAISAGKICSRSLKHLSIIECSDNFDLRRLQVSTPGLVTLNLVRFCGSATPSLGNMTLLESARVYLHNECEEDACLKYNSGVFCGANNNACRNCGRINEDCSSDLVLLGGIASAKHLELISQPQQIIFTRDLKHCPTFSNLKTLLLNEYWCEAPDLNPLACILKNSPVLEKLTLQLFSKGPNYKVLMKGSYSSTERSPAISEHLNIVEVKCNEVDDDKIHKVLRFMSVLNIRFSFE